MKFFFFLLGMTSLGLASCVSSKYSNSLEVDVVDRNGQIYSDYIVKVSNAEGAFIYSHLVNESSINKVYLNGIKPSIYKITAICLKTLIEAEKHVDYNGKRKKVTIEIPNIQYWLKDIEPVVNDVKGSKKLHF